jgi:NADPH-dependent glutamate synthase beta subunit-like oxidoreductase
MEPPKSFSTQLERHSEAFGFRVCYYTLLCMGSHVQGRRQLAKHYYNLARAYIRPCFKGVWAVVY